LSVLRDLTTSALPALPWRRYVPQVFRATSFPHLQAVRWSFRKFQTFIEYKANLESSPVIYVSPRKTSSLCPICGGRLIPNGQRLLKCECGLIADRDVVGSWNIRLRGSKSLKIDVESSVPPESPPMKTGGGKVTRCESIIPLQK